MDSKLLTWTTPSKVSWLFWYALAFWRFLPIPTFFLRKTSPCFSSQSRTLMIVNVSKFYHVFARHWPVWHPPGRAWAPGAGVAWSSWRATWTLAGGGGRGSRGWRRGRGWRPPGNQLRGPRTSGEAAAPGDRRQKVIVKWHDMTIVYVDRFLYLRSTSHCLLCDDRK